MKTMSLRVAFVSFFAFACVSVQLAVPASAMGVDRDGIRDSYVAIDMRTAEDLVAIGVIEFDSQDDDSYSYFALTATGIVEFVVAGTPSTVHGGNTVGSGGTTIVTGGTTSAT